MCIYVLLVFLLYEFSLLCTATCSESIRYASIHYLIRIHGADGKLEMLLLLTAVRRMRCAAAVRHTSTVEI